MFVAPPLGFEPGSERGNTLAERKEGAATSIAPTQVMQAIESPVFFLQTMNFYLRVDYLSNVPQTEKSEVCVHSAHSLVDIHVSRCGRMGTTRSVLYARIGYERLELTLYLST